METISQIDIDRIIANADNPRSEIGACEDLIANIKENGLLQPITVRWTKKRDKDGLPTDYEVIAGSRRLTALKALKWKKVPCVVMTCDDETAFKIATSENLVRENMSKTDEARAVARLLDEGHSPREVAGIFGKTPIWAVGRKKITEIPGALEAIENGKMNWGHAYAIAKANAENYEFWVSEARYYTPEQLEKRILDERTALKNAPFAWKDICKNCPKRSSCDPDLFGNIENEYCLDDECYGSNVAKFKAEKSAQFEKSGYSAVPEGELYDANHAHDKWRHKYLPTDTDDKDVQDTIKKLKKHGASARYFFDNDDRPHLVFRIADAPDAIEKPKKQESDKPSEYAIDYEASKLRKADLVTILTEKIEAIEKVCSENGAKELFEEFEHLVYDCLDYNGYEFEQANSDGENEHIEEPFTLHIGEIDWEENENVHTALAATMVDSMDSNKIAPISETHFKIPSFEEYKERAKKNLEEAAAIDEDSEED